MVGMSIARRANHTTYMKQLSMSFRQLCVRRKKKWWWWWRDDKTNDCFAVLNQKQKKTAVKVLYRLRLRSLQLQSSQYSSTQKGTQMVWLNLPHFFLSLLAGFVCVVAFRFCFFSFSDLIWIDTQCHVCDNTDRDTSRHQTPVGALLLPDWGFICREQPTDLNHRFSTFWLVQISIIIFPFYQYLFVVSCGTLRATPRCIATKLAFNNKYQV